MNFNRQKKKMQITYSQQRRPMELHLDVTMHEEIEYSNLIFYCLLSTLRFNRYFYYLLSIITTTGALR